MTLLRAIVAFAALTYVFSCSISAADAVTADGGRVYIIAVREDVMTPLKYLVRRGVKEAMENNADLLVLDMDTNGGRVDVTQDIIKILQEFKGPTATYVNTKAFSAGAFIAFATQKIYMADGSVIGAAAPIMLGPSGPTALPEGVEAKMVSGLKALVRTVAEKNGHNVEVVESMIDRTEELRIGDKVLNEKGKILTLTNTEAEETYGAPPKPLLSAGTLGSLEEVTRRMGFGSAAVVRIDPTGAEKLATFLTAMSPILLMIGVIGIYIEMKTPGFGLPGIVGVTAFAFYFLGSYIAGLAGIEWVAIFVIGLALVILELFVFPGTIFIGLVGAVMMVASLLMAMVDLYPGPFAVPTLDQLERPLINFLIAAVGSALVIMAITKYLPRFSVYNQLISTTASGEGTVLVQDRFNETMLGVTGVTISPLRPGGKAQFGEHIADVVSQGIHIEKGTKVRVIGHSGTDLLVEAAS